MSLESVVELLAGDRELLEELAVHGYISADATAFGPDEVETILVSQTLVRELEVNWAGVEVILRMRKQLIVAQHRLGELKGRED
jgi:hypothetical protein